MKNKLQLIDPINWLQPGVDRTKSIDTKLIAINWHN